MGEVDEKRGYEMDDETEHCRRCGSIIYTFSKGVAASDGSDYCIKCAEEADRKYLSRNVCSVCTKLLDKEEVKFVMPSRMYSDYFFDRVPIEYRLMCVKCYRKAEKLDMVRKPLVKIRQIRLKLKGAMAKRSASKMTKIVYGGN